MGAVRVLLVFVFLLLGAHAACLNEVFVSSWSGVDDFPAQSGGASSPLLSINYALSLDLCTNATVWVQAGIYLESMLVLAPLPVGLRIVAAPPSLPGDVDISFSLVSLDLYSMTWQGVTISSMDVAGSELLFVDCIFNSAFPTPTAVSVTLGSKVQFTNCIFTHSDTNANIVSDSSELSFKDCVIAFTSLSASFAIQDIGSTITLESCNVTDNLGGIYGTGSNLFITNTLFSGTQMNSAIRVSFGNLVVQNSRFYRNTYASSSYGVSMQLYSVTYLAQGGSAIAADLSSVDLSHSTFEENLVSFQFTFIPPMDSQLAAGAIMITSIGGPAPVTVHNCTFLNNVVENDWLAFNLGSFSDALGIFTEAGDVTITNTLFAGNSGADFTTYISINDFLSFAMITVRDTIFRDSLGRSLTTFGSPFSIEITNTVFDNIINLNVDRQPIVYLFCMDSLTVSNSVFSNLVGTVAIFSATTASIDGCTFTNLQSQDDVGSISFQSNELTMTNCYVSDVQVDNGPFIEASYISIDLISFRNNTFSRLTALADAVLNFGTVPFSFNISNCTFSDSNLKRSFLAVMGRTAMDECVFSNNTAHGSVLEATYIASAWVLSRTKFISNTILVPALGVIVTSTSNSAGTLFFVGCSFENNNAQSGSTLYIQNNGMTMESCNFNNNSVANSGGAISYIGITSGNGIEVRSSYFSNNRAIGSSTVSGGALSLSVTPGSSFSITSCIFEDNESPLGGSISVVTSQTSFLIPTNVDINNCTFKRNTGHSGGALYIGSYVSATIRSSVFEGNTASSAGGSIAVQDSRVNIVDTVVRQSTSSFQGGGFCLQTTLKEASTILRNVTFDSNVAIIGDGGGAYVLDSGSSAFHNCLFFNNSAPEAAGGAVGLTMNSTTLFNNTLFENNEAFEGGGLLVDLYAAPLILNSTFRNNYAETDGGAVIGTSKSQPVFVETRFIGNSGTDGGAVIVKGDTRATFQRCRFSQNTAHADGGGIFAASSTPGYPSLIQCEFDENDASNGGGMSCAEFTSMTCDRCTVRMNTATVSGGGVYMDMMCKASFINSSIEGNVARVGGGGIYAGSSSTLVLAGSVVSGNNASSGGAVQWGPAVSSTGSTGASQIQAGSSASLSGSVVITTSSFVHNFATLGGAIDINGQTAQITDCTFTNNQAQYGGCLYTVGRLTGNFSGNTFDSCNADIAGGGFFWDIPYSMNSPLQTCDSCFYTNNVAGYGANFATGPAAQVIDTNNTVSNLTVVNGNVGPIVLKVLDSYSQLVTSSYLALFAQVSLDERTGGELLGSTIVYGFDGIVTFPSVSVEGRFGSIYPLIFSMSGTPNLQVNVSLLGCSVGQEGYNSSSFQMCRDCSTGFYNLNRNGSCLPCPQHASCSGGSHIVAESNYWLLMKNGVGSTYDCPAGFCSSNGTCAPRRSGLLCGKCEEGYQNSDSVCIECKGTDSVSLFGNLCLLWIFITVLQLTSKAPTDNTTFISGLPKIVLFFLQTIPFVVTPHQKIRKFFSIFNFQFIFNFADKCSFKADFFENFLIYILLPAILFLFLMLNMVIHVILMYILRTTKSHYQKYVTMDKSLYIRTLTSLLLFSYTEVSQNVMIFLNCRTVGHDRVVASSPDISCKSAQYKHYSILAYILLALYVLSFPMFLAGFLIWAKRTQKLAAEKFSGYAGLLYQCFKPKYFFWEIIILIRRLIVIGVWVLAYSTTSARNLALFIFTFIMLIAHVHARPFASKLENDVETALLSLLVLLSGVGASQAYIQFSGDIAVFTSILVFLATIPVGIAIYQLTYAILMRFGIAANIPSKLPFKEFLRSSSSRVTVFQLKESTSLGESK